MTRASSRRGAGLRPRPSLRAIVERAAEWLRGDHVAARAPPPPPPPPPPPTAADGAAAAAAATPAADDDDADDAPDGDDPEDRRRARDEWLEAEAHALRKHRVVEACTSNDVAHQDRGS